MTERFGAIPYLTTDQMIEVDRAMVEDYRIDLIQMMENAGRALAQLARTRFLGGDPRGKRIVVLAGTGGNGGGALVGARRLSAWGADVDVFISKSPAEFKPVPARQLDILGRMGVPTGMASNVALAGAADLVIDGVIGYGLTNAPRGGAAELIRWANAQAAPVLALDTPSGLDTTSGNAHDPAIRATATMTLALPKEGLRSAEALSLVGELYLADIGVPPVLYTSTTLRLQVGALFARNDIIRLR